MNMTPMAALHTGGHPNQFTSQFTPIKPLLTGPAGSYQSSQPSSTTIPNMHQMNNSSAPSSVSKQFSSTTPLSALNLDLSFGGSNFGKSGLSTMNMPVSNASANASVLQQHNEPAISNNVSFNRKHDWTIQPANKLKFNQQFNQADRNKSGFLEGVVARR